MKAAAVFALRVLVLTLVLIIVFMIAINVAGMAQAPSPSAQAESTTATPELKSLYQGMRSTVTGTPWMLPFQFGRGLLWALFAYPVVRMLNTTRIATASIIAALFGVWSFALLMPNPLMPASVAHSHFWETLWSDLLLGAIVGWALAADAMPTARGPSQAMSAGSS